SSSADSSSITSSSASGASVGGGGGASATVTSATASSSATATASSSAIVSSSSSAVSSGSGGGTVTFFDHRNGMGSQAPTRLTGTVYAPNGKDPLPKIFVYAAKKINPFPAKFCDSCAAPIDEMYASATTGPDGTFALDLGPVPYDAKITLALQV